MKSMKINDHVWAFQELKMVANFLIVGQEKALLCDTCYGFEGKLKDMVETITQLPLYVINTHGHRDHTGGNALFDEIYIHSADVELLSDHTYTVNPVTKETMFDLGGLSVQVLETPGHTLGSIALYINETKELFAGDSINDRAIYMFPTSSYQKYVKSMENLEKLEINKIYACHGTLILDRSYIEKLKIAASKRLRNEIIPIKVQTKPGFYKNAYRVGNVGFYE